MKKLPTTWQCSHCGAVIPAEDVNVATDVALCRSCGQASRFSDLVKLEEEEQVNLDEIPKRVQVQKTMRGLEVSCKTRQAAVWFFIFFAVFWNGIVGIFVTQVISGFFSADGPDWGLALFLIPFVLLGLGVIATVIYMLFGGMRLTLNPGKGELFYGVGEIGRRKSFVLSKKTRIEIRMSSINQNGRNLEEIAVEQPEGKPLKFGAMLDDDNVLDYLVAMLKAMRE